MISPSASSSARRHVRPTRIASFALLAAAWIAVPLSGAESAVLAWNAAVLRAVRAETTPPPLASRNLAMVHLALDQAWRENEARRDVVAIITGCVASSALFPGRRGEFEQLRDRLLAEVSPAATPAEWSRALQCAAHQLEARRDDGATRSVTYIPRAEPGNWRRTAPFFRPPELPQWSRVRTFAIRDLDAFVPAGPPALNSAVWNAALDEIRRVGGRNSTERTDDEAVTARFWSDFSYTTTPPGHWNEIAGEVARAQGFDEAKTARLFATLNVAMADASVVCWQAKYHYNFWRPITALAEEQWQPLLNTPAHPEYPSGHSAFSGAAATVLAAFVGTDECAFSVRSDALKDVERNFTHFSAAAREISLSRVFAGIHFRFSCEDGLVLGQSVAAEVLRQQESPDDSTRATEVAAR